LTPTRKNSPGPRGDLSGSSVWRAEATVGQTPNPAGLPRCPGFSPVFFVP
jgi:hypothetical protein